MRTIKAKRLWLSQCFPRITNRPAQLHYGVFEVEAVRSDFDGISDFEKLQIARFDADDDEDPPPILTAKGERDVS